MSRSVPPPVTLVHGRGRGLAARARMAAVESASASSVARPRRDRSPTDAAATLAAGGKRLRPMLVLLCAGPGAGAAAIRAATAIELVHMATLVHDDVLDAAPLRRGQPTVRRHARAASARSAAGDLLFSRAFAELAATATAGEPSARSSCSRTPRWRWRSASWPSAATPSTSRSPPSATSSAAG